MADTSEIVVGLYDHYEALTTTDSSYGVKHYYGLLGIYALARTAEETNDPALWERVEQILRRFPDQIEHPRYNFPCYRIGGIAQAYLVAQGRMADRLSLVEEYAEEMMAAPRDSAGILAMPRPPESRIWIDVAMVATPYLLWSGLALDNQRYVDEAVHQTIAMYDALLDHRTGLLHQCKGFIAPDVLSTDHWGRGNGWGYFGLTELVRGLPADHPRRHEVEQRFRALSDALLPYQTSKGLWRQEIPDSTAWEESSGTGLIAYGFGIGLSTGLLAESRYGVALRNAVAGLGEHAINPDYSTELSCPGTLCPGEGEAKGTPTAYVELREPYQDEPHGFGPIMLALTQGQQVGMTELVIDGAKVS